MAEVVKPTNKGEKDIIFGKMEKIKYEFWKEEQKWYAKIFRRVFPQDLNSIRREISDRILQTNKKNLNWLDIGTGDGSTLMNILKKTKPKGNFKIKITIIEPSKYAIKPLKEKLNQLKNINYKIINSKLEFRFLEDKYDCIILCHSNYYLATSKNSFKRLYLRLYSHLNKGGILIIQTISDHSDFNMIEKPRYSEASLGEKTYKILKEINSKVKFKKMPTRIEVTQYLKKHLSSQIREEILHFYRFVTQKEKTVLSEKELKRFIQRIKRKSKKKNNRYFLDFMDCIISIRRKK